MGRRQGPSEERRTAILEAAEAVFIERGYSGASIREIARRAGVSSALLYWYFPNKADLFAATITRRAETYGLVSFAPAVFDQPPAVFLPRLARAYMSMVFLPEQAGISKLLLREADQLPEVLGRLRGLIINRLLTPLSTYFARQRVLGRVVDVAPEYLAQAFMGMFVTYFLRRALLQDPALAAWSQDEYVEAAVWTFLRGVLCDRSGLPPPPAGHPPREPEAPPPSAPPAMPRRAAHITLDEGEDEPREPAGPRPAE